MSDGRVDPRHLQRSAALYIRQSHGYQVIHNTGSTAWQLSLHKTLTELGWQDEQILLFDDLGTSARSGVYRGGFKDLLEHCRLKKIGIVMVVDETRVSRNNADWGLLVDVLQLTDTLFYCHDMLLDLADSGDYVVMGYMQLAAVAASIDLGNKMRESRAALAELGTLKMRLPTGYVRVNRTIHQDGREEIRKIIKLIYAKFDEIKSARGVARFLFDNKITIPRARTGGKITWIEPTGPNIYSILRNPTYAGAFVYGKSFSVAEMDQNYVRQNIKTHHGDPKDWRIVIQDAFDGYITWSKFLEIRATLSSNAYTKGKGKESVNNDRSLLNGLIFCGTCNKPLRVSYFKDGAIYYICGWSKGSIDVKNCKSVRADWLDKVITQVLCNVISDDEICAATASTQLQTEATPEKLPLFEEKIRSVETEINELKNMITRGLRLKIPKELIEEYNEQWKNYKDDLNDLIEQVQNFKSFKTPKEIPVEREKILGQLPESLKDIFARKELSVEDRRVIVRCLVKKVEVVRNTACHAIIHWHTGNHSTLFVPRPRRRSRINRQYVPEDDI